MGRCLVVSFLEQQVASLSNGACFIKPNFRKTGDWLRNQLLYRLSSLSSRIEE